MGFISIIGVYILLVIIFRHLNEWFDEKFYAFDEWGSKEKNTRILATLGLVVGVVCTILAPYFGFYFLTNSLIYLGLAIMLYIAIYLNGSNDDLTPA